MSDFDRLASAVANRLLAAQTPLPEPGTASPVAINRLTSAVVRHLVARNGEDSGPAAAPHDKAEDGVEAIARELVATLEPYRPEELPLESIEI